MPGNVLLHVVVSRGSPDAPHLLRVHPQTVLAVCLDQGKRLQVIYLSTVSYKLNYRLRNHGTYLPQPIRVARNPDFGEADQFASGLPGFVDPVNGLLDTQLQVEPLRDHKYCGTTNLIEGDIRRAQW